MQFSILSIMAVAATFVSGLAVPASEPVLARASCASQESQALLALRTLNTTAATPLQSIKSTLAKLTADASAADKAAATTAIKSQVANLAGQINLVASHIKSNSRGSGIFKRQDDSEAIANLVGGLVASISSVADEVVSSLGLTAALSILNPLVGSLNGLLAALQQLLDQLLLLVKQIVDNLLTGLSAGLAGITL